MRYVIEGAYPAPLPFRYTKADGYTATAEAVLPAMLADGVTVVEVDDPPAAPDGQVTVWDGAEWAFAPAPPPPVPVSVKPRQARLALHAAGLLDDVETMLADPAHRATQIEWEYAAVVERASPLVEAIGGANGLGLTSDQIDDLFRVAATL